MRAWRRETGRQREQSREGREVETEMVRKDRKGRWGGGTGQEHVGTERANWTQGAVLLCVTTPGGYG